MPRYIKRMQRSAWPAWFVGALLVSGTVSAGGELPASQSATVIGAMNPLLSEGSQALELGRFAEGVRLTLAGLEQPATTRDQAAGHSNVCAGYAAMKRFEEALEHCNRALELDRTNWRTYNNRAAVFVGLKQYDLAMTDVNAGLSIAPNSSILLKSREVVIQHTNAANRDRRRKPKTA
jgi:tetratricopeptide (TPR) repeat protein